MAGAGDGDVLFLHRLQQRRLGARAGAVDLVRHQQLAEDRAGNEAERTFAARAFLEHLAADDVGWHQVRSELDAPHFEAEHGAERFDQLGLGEAGDADQHAVAAGQHGDERLLHHTLLAEDHRADAVLGGGDVRGRGFRGAHDHVFELLYAFAARQCHHALLLRENCRRLLPAKGYPVGPYGPNIHARAIIPDSRVGISHLNRNPRYFWGIGGVQIGASSQAQACAVPRRYT